ncbi:hypothetical protein, partial [Parabacteroides sp.]
MKKLYANMKYLIFLVFAVLVSACSEDGVVTLVLEEDEPHSVAKMIVGKWKISNAERADENGSVIDRPSITDIPELNFSENGIGYLGDGKGDGNKSFKWYLSDPEHIGGSDKYDNGNPSVTFNGQRWYIFQLTRSMLILYRITDKYIIIYYYYRVGDYEGDNEPPIQTGYRVCKIESSFSYSSAAAKESTVYTFDYDDQGRIQKYSIGNGNIMEEFSYRYNGVEEVYVDGSEQYKGFLKDGRLVYLYTYVPTTPQPQLVASPIYNDEGYMSCLNDKTFSYEAGNMIGGSGYMYSYEYGDLENNTNIDLNSIISDCSSYEHQYSHYSLFAPFGFYGKFSKNLLKTKRFLTDSADVYYVYLYEKDSEGRIAAIVCNCIDKYRESILNTTTFKIFYEEVDNNSDPIQGEGVLCTSESLVGP